MTTTQDDRASLLEALDQVPDSEIPCRAVDLYTSAAWISDTEDEQKVAAAACRAYPCPLIDQCRAYGLTNTDELGAYGGLTYRERRNTS